MKTEMETLTKDKTKKWTVDDYQQLDEDTRCEVIDAELIMSPAPLTNHQKISGRLYLSLIRFLVKNKVGELFYAPLDVYFDRENVYQPDIVFIDSSNIDIVEDKGIMGSPDLLVEIISPSSSHIDRYVKKKKYEEFRVKEYWIVDPKNKTLEIFSLNEQKQYEMFLFLAEEGKVQSKLLEGLSFELGEIFI